MLKSIRNKLKERKERKLWEKRVKLEEMETLCTICLYLEWDSHYSRNSQRANFGSHFNSLKAFSTDLREEVMAEEVRLYGGKRKTK